MYQLDFIAKLVLNAGKKINSAKVKPYPSVYEKGFTDSDYYDKLPDFNPIYKETIRKHNEVSVHSQLGVFPFNILKNKAPNQSNAEWDYQMGIYQSITNSTWDGAKSRTKIIGNPQNYSIDFKNDEQLKYFNEDYPAYHSLVSYFFDIVRDKKLDFPNQILLIKPEEIPGQFGFGEDDKPTFVSDSTQKINPIASIVEEWRIVDFKDNDYLLIISEDKSRYKHSGTFYDDGLIFEFYDKNNIWYFIQDGRNSKHEPTFSAFLMYQHDYGWLPARKLQGKPLTYNDKLIYESVFAQAIPTLNTVIGLWSSMMMSFYSTMFPRTMMLVDDCNHSIDGESCAGGQIYDTKSLSMITCPKCKGSGDNVQDTPTGIYKVRMNKAWAEKGMPLTPPIQFAEPNGNTLTITKEYLKELLGSAFSFFYKTDQANATTATGEMLDEQEFQSMLVHFNNELWDLLEFSVEVMGFLRWRSSFVKPSFMRATYFNFRTPKVITEEIKTAKDAKLPDSYQKPLITQGVKTRFNNDEFAIWSWELQTEVDGLWNKDELEVNAGIGRTCSKSQAILHSQFTTILSQCIESKPFNGDVEKFKAIGVQKQRDILLAKAKEIELAISGTEITNNSETIDNVGGGE